MKYGSLVNYVDSRCKNPEPEIGMGATILCWSDRQAGTVVKITDTQVHIQHDIATRTDKNGMSENQEYTYTPDPNGIIEIFRMTRKGGYKSTNSSGLLLGVREQYYDYSF